MRQAICDESIVTKDLVCMQFGTADDEDEENSDMEQTRLHEISWSHNQQVRSTGVLSFVSVW